MLVSCGFKYSRYNIINRKLAAVDNLKYHLADLITIQTIILVGINESGIHNL